MESLKRALENIGRMWANLTATQRVIIGGAAALMIVALVFGSIGTTQAWVRVAGAEADQGAILKKLRERNQKHEVRGTDIYVPKEDADRIVLELAGEGAVSDNAVWKFLEQSDIFATRWDKEKRYQIALQTRLEGMIRGIESVKNAGVVINPGSTNHQLGFAGPKASASVRVDLKDGLSLTRKNVQAIAGLVARAVSGVEEDQVHIMDGKGNAYRAAKANGNISYIDSIRDHEKAIEEDIRNRIKDARDFWGASVVVRIQAKTVTSETDDVRHGRAVPFKTREGSVRKGPTGIPVPRIKGEGGAEFPADPPTREQETTTDEESVVDRKHTKEFNPAGDILHVTVGVLIPVEEAVLAEKERQLPKLRDFVLKAAGPQARMEDISVQLIPTKAPAPIAAAEDSAKALAWIWSHWPKVVLGLITIFAVWVLFRVIQRSTAQDTVEELQALTTALTETQEGPAGIVAPAESDLARLRQEIQEMVGRNPQNVAASLKSFMSGR